MRGGKVIVVTPDSSKDLKERVYRLRYQVYVEEMKPNLANDERMLHDKYDDYSTNFLVEVNGEDIGTMRHAAKRNGPLESEEQHESWRSFISFSEKDPDTVCELARWIVNRNYRGTQVALMLGYSVYQHCVRVGTFRIYGLGKTGGVAGYYRKLGARECIREPLPWILRNHIMGQYILMRLDLGAPWSFRRAWMRSRYALLHMLTLVSIRARNALIRGRRGYRRQS